MAYASRRRQFGRFSLSTPGIITCIFFILYLISLRYYHSVSYRDPTSYFFDPSRAYERRYSAKRVGEADAFLRKASGIKPPVRTEGELPTICLGIVTVRRRGDQYVGLTVASLLDGFSEHERKSVFLDLLVGNSDPSEHPIYSEQWVKTLPDRMRTYSRDDPNFGQIREWEEGGWYRNKTIYDYTYLMRDCYETGAEYVAMIEDDVLAVKGWLSSALQALSTVEQRTPGRDWIYLRLFYADDLLGWNSEEWPRYLGWSFIIWALLTCVMITAKGIFKSIPTKVIWITSCGFIPATIALLFMAGRQTIWPITPGVHEMNKYGCCSQGLLYPRSIIPRLLEHSDVTTDWLVDMMIEKIADHQGWSRWAVVPPLLQHIGATSSKGYGFDTSAKSLWNFRFEEYPY